MRIAFAEFAQESDSFSPLIAYREDFAAYGLYVGDEMLERMRGVGPIGGFLEVVAEQTESVELRPLIRAWGSAGGHIADRTIRELTECLVSGLKQSLPVDGVFLSLHGAAASESEDDVEGFVLQTVREIVGKDVPIAVALDHHANVTHRMVEFADLLVGHETQPHDPPATGRKVARLLFRMLRGEIRPTIRWRKIPMITPQDQFLTSSGPMQEWFDLARHNERLAGVLDVSPYPMQPWLDVAEGGWSVVVHTDQDAALADSIASEMANKAWNLREQFWRSERVTPDEAVRQAVAADRGMIILSDTGDSVYGGAPGESTCILRALLKQPMTSLAFVPMVDAVALEAALAAGVGATLNVNLGGRMDKLGGPPLAVSGQVQAISQGFTVDLQDRGICDLKRCALLAVDAVRIALLDHRSFAVNHPVLYTHLGLDMADAKLVVVKTASNFQFFSRWRRGLIRVDSPGTTQSDLTAFSWKRIPRPIYPLDPLTGWLCAGLRTPHAPGPEVSS